MACRREYAGERKGRARSRNSPPWRPQLETATGKEFGALDSIQCGVNILSMSDSIGQGPLPSLAEIGKLARLWREVSRWSQTDLAHAIGSSQAQVSRVEGAQISATSHVPDALFRYIQAHAPEDARGRRPTVPVARTADHRGAAAGAAERVAAAADGAPGDRAGRAPPRGRSRGRPRGRGNARVPPVLADALRDAWSAWEGAADAERFAAVLRAVAALRAPVPGP